jgi:hypothetical protein
MKLLYKCSIYLVVSGLIYYKSMEKSSTNHCNFFLTKKKKYCKFSRLEGEEYCYHHVGITNTKDYVKCPADPKHLIKRSDVEAHVKICSKTKQV